jgi:hypothetical protein
MALAGDHACMASIRAGNMPRITCSLVEYLDRDEGRLDMSKISSNEGIEGEDQKALLLFNFGRNMLLRGD